MAILTRSRRWASHIELLEKYKQCGEYRYLNPRAFWNITDFGAKCEKCETINTITLEKEELKKQVDKLKALTRVEDVSPY
jgi:hypothetical protein